MKELSDELAPECPPYQYWAFISYSSKDRAWARWLHGALENYRLPTKLVEHPTPVGEPAPERFHPLFWDRAELTAHHDLGALIERSLRGSRYLIVICSPDAAQSPWVEKEIQAFHRMHSSELTLSLIVAGEPNAKDDTNCFPATLRAREPKAPDARGEGDGKTNAKLMLLATMLGVPFDRLKRRDRERKKRLLSFSLAGALVVLAGMAWLAWEMMAARDAESEASLAERVANQQVEQEIIRSARMEWGTAKSALENDNLSIGLAHAAESLRYNQSLPVEKQLDELSQEIRERVLESATRENLPLLKPITHELEVRSANFSPDGATIVTASRGTARIWDATTGSLVCETMRHHHNVESAVFSPDGKRVLTASVDETARLWEAATGEPVPIRISHSDWLNSANFSPDGSRIVTASEDRTARIWDAETGEPLGLPMRHEGHVNSASFSSDGLRIVTASDDHSAKVWDSATGEALGSPMRHELEVYSASFSPDGSRIVTASADQTAQLWDAETGGRLGAPLEHTQPVMSACFSPDGLRVVTAGGAARIWDASTGFATGFERHHRGEVITASFSLDGLRIVTAGTDDKVQIWGAVAGRRSEPIRQESHVDDAWFSDDLLRLITTSRKGEPRLWEATTGRPVADAPPEFWTGNQNRTSIYQQIIHSAFSFSIHVSDAASPAMVVRPDDLVQWNGWRIDPDGIAGLIPVDERVAWRSQILSSPPEQDDEWRRFMRWKLSDPRARTITMRSKTGPSEHVEREITWALAHLEDTRRNILNAISGRWLLDSAYDLDPGSPLIHLAFAAVEEHASRREFLKAYGLERLAAAEAISDKAAHQTFAGTFRAKAAVILWLQDDEARAAQIFADLLARHDPNRQTWGRSAWIEKLDDFEWPDVFREALQGLADSPSEFNSSGANGASGKSTAAGTGKKFTSGIEVKISGPAVIDEATVRAHLSFKEGTLYSGDKIDESVRSLYLTGLVEEIQVLADEADSKNGLLIIREITTKTPSQ